MQTLSTTGAHGYASAPIKGRGGYRDLAFEDSGSNSRPASSGRLAEPLRSASILARHSGICRNEVLKLMKDCVRLPSAHPGNGKASGELTIKHGLKRRARKRKLVVDGEMKAVLERLIKESDCEYVFTSPHDRAQPLGPWVIEEQMAQLRKKIKTHADAGLHALRHTFLTEAEEYTDPFTLQYVAGHDNIKTTMRYVHPREEAVEKLFVRLGNLERPEGRVECKRSVQNPVQSEMPSDADLAKLLNTFGLSPAEVVELADTPSKSSKSSVFSKFRVINQVASKSYTYPPYLTNHS